VRLSYGVFMSEMADRLRPAGLGPFQPDTPTIYENPIPPPFQEGGELSSRQFRPPIADPAALLLRLTFINNKEVSVTLANTLAEQSFGIVVRDLEGFGNRLNEQHRQSLRRMLGTLLLNGLRRDHGPYRL
jgi:hypothetical protein